MKKTHVVGRRAAVAGFRSETSQEGDDDETFFFLALQLAARERMAQMKDGRHLLAIVLLSNAGDADNNYCK